MKHTSEMHDQHVFVHGFLSDTVSRNAHGSAVRDSAGSWTYADLDVRSARAACWLADHGVRRGDRVAVRASSTRLVAALMYGCSRLGAIFVPLSPSLKAYQLGEIVDDAEPTLVLTDDPAQADALPGRTYEISAPFSDSPTQHTHPAPESHGSDDPVLLLYTSGSTAQPKGVLCTHRQVCFAVRAIAEQLRYQSGDVVWCRLPLSFDYGLYQILLATLAGCELVLADTNQHVGLLAELRRCGATVVPLVPSLATMLLTLAHRHNDRDLPPIRLFTNTGEHLPATIARELRERFTGAGVQMMFGLSECKRVSIGDVDGDLIRPDSVGRPLAGTEVCIVNTAGQPVSNGEIGEITVRGPHLMAGYWRDPQLTSQVYRADSDTHERVLHTGDYGWVDADGYLYFRGRRDNLFKRRATRVSTTEIEAAAEVLPGVHTAVAIPPTADRDLALYITGTSTPADVLRALRTMLDPAKVPATCHHLDSIPLTTNGKVDRSRLATLTAGELS